MVKYAPRKVYIRESGGYVELSYTEFCRCRESDQTYMDKLFIPIQGCLLEVVREQYTDFYRDKERWRYLQKLDTKNRLLSLDGFTDSEGNPLDFITDEAVDIAETVVNAVMVDRLKAALPLLSDSEQELIQAIFFDGLSEREVGARLGITQTGLTGSADATFVLEKEKRASDTAKLYVTGRDTPYQEYTLRFRDCRWELVERKTQEQLAKETIPDVLFRLVDFMRDKEEWIGTATELLAAMGETETIPTVITKWLNEYRTTFLSENRICYQYSRRKDGRRIALARRAGDSGDGGDSDIRIPPCYCH